MSETDLQLGGGYTYQWECAILLALNYFHEPVSYSSTLYDLVTGFLGQVDEIHLEGEDREKEIELEDINLYGGGRRILVQVKTMQAEESHWTPGKDALLKSLYRFCTSRYLVDEPDDTRFVFLTNRPFNSTLGLLNQAIRAGELAESPEAQELFDLLKRYAQRKKRDTPNLDRFRQMLARTALVKYLDVGTVKANVQAKLQAYGRTDWKQAYESLFAHFAYQSTRVGGGAVTPGSLKKVLGPRSLEEPVLRGLLARTDRRVLVGLAVLAVLIVAASAALYLQQRPKPPPPMSGTYNVAVAGFAEQGHSGNSETGRDLARSIHSPLQQALGEMEKKLKEIDPAYTVEIREPDLVGTARGDTAEKRETWAAGVAHEIKADVVVYGIVETDGDEWQATLEFYIRPESFDEAEEIIGAHGLGQPFPFAPGGEPAERLKASSTGDVRIQALTRVVVGLSHYALGEYAEALEILKPATKIAGWEEDQGKEVIYLLTGNAAGKLAGSKLGEAGHVERTARNGIIATAEKFLAQAEADYQLALGCDAEYARAYIGLGDVLYLRALLPFARSLDYGGVDTAILDEAIATYQQAQGAEHQAAGANVAAKVYFGLGQCYLMRARAGGMVDGYAPAIDAFEAVITAYGDGAEPLLRERAAESHARLGLIARFQGDDEGAFDHYALAISLTRLADRKATWQQRLEELESVQEDSA